MQLVVSYLLNFLGKCIVPAYLIPIILLMFQQIENYKQFCHIFEGSMCIIERVVHEHTNTQTNKKNKHHQITDCLSKLSFIGILRASDL